MTCVGIAGGCRGPPSSDVRAAADDGRDDEDGSEGEGDGDEVDVDDDDVVCVMLEDVEVRSDIEHDNLCRHDLLLVKQSDILHPDFAERRFRPAGRSLH